MIERIKGLILQEIFITKRSLEVIIDTVWFSALSVIVFGLIAQYLVGTDDKILGQYLVMGLLLWEIVRINQFSLSLNPLWNIWSRNLSNLFITPLSKGEYLLSQMISAALKSFIILVINACIAALLFDFNILELGFSNIIFYFASLSLFAWSVGLMIMGIIFMFGTRIQALAWGLIFLFQPVMAVFFPVEILPRILQLVAYFLPPTYIFEAARAQMVHSPVDSQLLLFSTIQNIAYFALSLYIFDKMFKISQRRGQFAKNDEG